MKRALVLVDLQEAFLGAPGLVPPREELLAHAAALLDRARSRGVSIAHVRLSVRPGVDRPLPHWDDTRTARCTPGDPAHATPPALAERPGEPVFHKTGYSAFRGEGFCAWLESEGIEGLILGGVHLHGCVRATALEAIERGFEVELVESAVGSYDALHAELTRCYLDERGARSLPLSVVMDSFADGASPATPEACESAAAAAVERVRAARADWVTRTLEERATCIEALARCLEEQSEPIARLMVEEIGKPLSDARGELIFAGGLVRAALHTARKLPDRLDGARLRALGIVALVSPYNNPVAVPIGKLVPALLYGNGVVWKPSPLAERAAERVCGLFEAAGLPAGLVSLAKGGREMAEAVMECGAVDAVTLTGSMAAGLAGQAICARRSRPFQGELGGNNATIVWSDADLDAAAPLLAADAFGSAGQRCTAGRRLIVAEEVVDAFVARLVEATGALVWGDPRDEATQVGPLVSEAACARVAAAVERARNRGAAIVTPHPEPQRSALREQGPYYPPTIVLGLMADDELVQNETFGPVVVVQRARSWEEALALLNGVPHGLVASLITASPKREAEFLERAAAGILKLGAGTAGAAPDRAFGGWGASGVGPAEHGDSDREFYTRVQTVLRGPLAASRGTES